MNDRTYRILVVDDNPGDIYLLRKSLKEAGVRCELITLEDGAQALDFIQEQASEAIPDLAVFDLNLPRISGVELVTAWRQSPRLNRVPMIVISSAAIVAQPGNSSVLEDPAIDVLLPKPVDLPEFLQLGARIRELLMQSANVEDPGEAAHAAEPHIVLVEDNDGDVYLLKKALSAFDAGAKITRYANGEDAIRTLADESAALPDVILVDLNLPGSEGFEVLTAIRTKPWLVDVPIGVFTSSDDNRDRHRVALLGAERYIYKPPDLSRFITEVGQGVMELLRERQERRKSAAKENPYRTNKAQGA